MHLRSITLKGFKSFPDRTKLDFSPGVSVIVGPNGSGKSNITDAVLWALGEQKPLAVRGQTMQDVIFAGGHGLPSRNAAEVEVVIDNSDGALQSDFSEISIVRRLERSGDGEYRLNGARCRLVDVLEVLSDTGLGKEMHSVVSQGRVEAIVHSKPRDRRLLIEEAAGLGKHRKRRRRAQLKLERTEANLARALDVEREARSRLRPLKRQAEAAELHERLERQSLEARIQLVRETVRASAAELAAAESEAAQARAARDELDRLLGEVATRREQAEERLAAHGRVREQLSGRYFAARSAAERIALRLEHARETERSLGAAGDRRRNELEALERALHESRPGEGHSERIAELESELSSLEADLGRQLEAELAELTRERDAAAERQAELEAAAVERRAALREAEEAADAARVQLREAEQAAEAARREAAAVGAELATVNQFLRQAAAAPGDAPALAEDLGVEPGYEAAVAAVLGPLLAAGMVGDLREGESLLDARGNEGGIALVAAAGRESLPGDPDFDASVPDGVASGDTGPDAWAISRAGRFSREAEAAAPHPLTASRTDLPPPLGAEPLIARTNPAESIRPTVERLLAEVWLVDDLSALPAAFSGVAVTKTGRLFVAATGELRQAPAHGEERLLERRNRREELIAASERAAAAEREALARSERARQAVAAADAAREEAESALRGALRGEQDAVEALHRADWLIRLRQEQPGEGPNAVRRAQVSADLRAERKLAERTEREHAQRLGRMEELRGGIARAASAVEAARRAIAGLSAAEGAVAGTRESLAAELRADEAVGERTAAELRSCAHEEAEIQSRLRSSGDAVTAAEVRAQQARDVHAEARHELEDICARLGLDPDPTGAAAGEALAAELRGELTARIERLARRREQLGPVNPLAGREYEEAVGHVEELEAQRDDLESALAELEGLIRETDRRIRESFEETFEAAARNFEEVVAHLFPGGRGRLRLVQPEAPRAVVGGEELDGPDGEPRFAAAAATSVADEAGTEADAAEEPSREQAQDPGVEVEVTPAGKATKRLSLLSGGEKSLVALAFLFAVFLARPCPFYVLDEVEAALDDTNIDRFLQLVREYCDRAQFIIVTHQRRTMDVADTLYGVSMGGDGVSKVVSRRLAGRPAGEQSLEAA